MTDTLTRRLLLKRAAQLGFMGAAGPLAINLAAAGEAAAFDATDYKALVCLFLYGGNDYANTVVPYDLSNYDRYGAIRGGGPNRTRGGIAFGRAELDATALTPAGGPALTDDLQYALAPPLTGLKNLFDAGKLAVQLNVGPLVAPLTLAEYQSANAAVPPKLFSHNDQQSVWQALASEGASAGWGGRLGDLALASNGNAMLSCISAASNAVFVSGRQALQYQISPQGAVGVNMLKEPNYTPAGIREAMREIIRQPSAHVFEEAYAAVTRRSIDQAVIANAALGEVVLNTAFAANNPLASQMRVVARLIGARAALGMRRQVFFVSLGGFDHHNTLMRDHPPLMAKVNDAMSAFYAATVELGVANDVVTFTASDFGRTLTSNADGSDHGWGGHHFVMGGAVRGGRFYGTAPHVSVSSDDQVGQGRLLPSTSIDEFGGTLAKWFGASASEVREVFANSARFAHANVDFV